MYDSKYEPYDNYIDKAKEIIQDIEGGKIRSCLGDVPPEGIVLKVLNRDKGRGKTATTRYKFVRNEFSEQNRSKKQKLPELTQDQIIEGIGKVYATEARLRKAIQHLEEQGKWKSDTNKNIGPMVSELDADLLKESEQEIKDLLFVRFWSQISKTARGDIQDFSITLIYIKIKYIITNTHSSYILF